ncbi:hypothetical protein L1887_44513 [Cichorium endivia]|nr:hypothetical protein L1887_44513 [Cichorium endivia]
MHVVTAHAEEETGFGAIADTVQPSPSLPHAGASNCHRLIAAPTPAAAHIAEALTLLCRWRDKTDALRLWHGSLVWRGFGGTPEMARSARMSECGADRSIVLAQRSSRGCLPQQGVPSICTLPEARVQPGTAERGTAFDSASLGLRSSACPAQRSCFPKVSKETRHAFTTSCPFSSGLVHVEACRLLQAALQSSVGLFGTSVCGLRSPCCKIAECLSLPWGLKQMTMGSLAHQGRVAWWRLPGQARQSFSRARLGPESLRHGLPGFPTL